jgi:hypothetical protein
MAKDNKNKVTVEIDTDDLGVVSHHRYRMATDEDYRARALTPPGGQAPDVELPEGNGLSAAVVAAASA